MLDCSLDNNGPIHEPSPGSDGDIHECSPGSDSDRPARLVLSSPGSDGDRPAQLVLYVGRFSLDPSFCE